MLESRTTLWASLLCGLLLTLTRPSMGQPLRGDLDDANLGRLKIEIRAYVSSGRYQQEMDQIANDARRYLELNLPRFQGRKPALVLDIDETSVSNYPYLDRTDFGFIPVSWNEWADSGQAQALPATQDLYRFARTHGVAVFFISARPEDDRNKTEANLARAGYKDYQELVLKGPDAPLLSAEYKAGQRRRLTEQGWSIVVNLGDQLSDLEGGYAEGQFKLPNPMYFVP